MAEAKVKLVKSAFHETEEQEKDFLGNRPALVGEIFLNERGNIVVVFTPLIETFVDAGISDSLVECVRQSIDSFIIDRQARDGGQANG